MGMIPQWVQDQLKSEHDGRYRLRWSSALQTILLEQKVARGIQTPPERLVKKLRRLEPHRPGITEEVLKQARDGYLTFLDLRPSDRAPCAACGGTVPLQPNTWAYARCPFCGKDQAMVHVEPGPRLLEHLRYLDFNRGGDERVLRDVEASEEMRAQSARRENRNALEDAVKEDWRDIIESPMVGYTGKEFA